MLKAALRKTILLCPGQGHFDVKSLKALSRFRKHKKINDMLQVADDVLPTLKLSKYIRNPDLVESDLEVQQMIQRTVVQQPLLILTSAISHEISKLVCRVDYVEKADMMIGHSLGEISGLVLQDAISLDKGLMLGYQRGKLMEQIISKNSGNDSFQHGKFGMYALIFQPKQYGDVIECLKSVLANIANYNTYSQVVISGPKNLLEDQIAQVKSKIPRLRAVDLNVSVPFHHPVLGPIEKELRMAFGKANVKTGRLSVPMISDLDAEITATSEGQVDKVIKVTSRPVMFSKCLETLCGSSAKSGISYDFINYGTATHGLVKRFFRDLEKTGRGTQVPEYTNQTISSLFEAPQRRNVVVK